MNLLYLLHFVPGRTTIVSLIYAWNSRKQPSEKRCACAPIALPLFDFCFRLLAGWSKVLKLPHNLHRSHVAKKSLHSLFPHSSWYFFFAASTAYVHVYGFQFSLIKPVRVQFAQGCFIVARVPCHAMPRANPANCVYFIMFSLKLKTTTKWLIWTWGLHVLDDKIMLINRNQRLRRSIIHIVLFRLASNYFYADRFDKAHFFSIIITLIALPATYNVFCLPYQI